MRFSMLLATLNRKEYVLKSIDYLLKQDFGDFEILIVDQSDVPYYEYTTLDKRIKYFHVDFKGLSKARNYGLEHASGDYICLVDDDGYYKDINTLSMIDSFISKYNPCVCCGNIFDECRNIVKGTKTTKRIRYINSIKYSQSPSMVIKSSFIKTQKFNNDLGLGCKYGSTEESEIVLAALKNRLKCFYTNEFKIYHPLPASNDYSIEKWTSYSRGFGAAMKICSKKYSFFWAHYLLYRATIRRFGAYLIIHRIRKPSALKNDISGLRALWQAYREYEVKK